MDSILSSVSPVYGFCPFESIKDGLIECRAKQRLPEKAKTVIVFLFPYYLGDGCYNGSDLSKYAVVPDYHDVLIPILSDACKRLKDKYPDEDFVTFTDNSPVPEVRSAVYAGLGVKGRNGLFISREYGSWVFIGEIVTTMEIKCEPSEEIFCSGCGKCIEACPTGSITENGINRQTCLSDITQRKGELSEAEKALIKNTGCLWGCDICQNVCPMNKNKKTNPLGIFTSDIKLCADAKELEGRAYAWRGRKTIERNIDILYNEKGKTI